MRWWARGWRRRLRHQTVRLSNPGGGHRRPSQTYGSDGSGWSARGHPHGRRAPDRQPGQAGQGGERRDPSDDDRVQSPGGSGRESRARPYPSSAWRQGMGLPSRTRRPLGGPPRSASPAQAVGSGPPGREPRSRPGLGLPSVYQNRLAGGYMSDPRPIGIFDSGVGGLTVLKAIRERLPLESTIYVADLLHVPYGPRYQDEVRGFAMDIIRYLETRDVKLVVIACNTATAAALSHARELFEVPIVGVISPGAQAAVDAAKNNRIGVISTEGTMRSQEYLHAIKEIDPMVGVYQKACPELVDIVESGQADSKRAEQVLHRDLADSR